MDKKVVEEERLKYCVTSAIEQQVKQWAQAFLWSDASYTRVREWIS
jgi:hypothetical protein